MLRERNSKLLSHVLKKPGKKKIKKPGTIDLSLNFVSKKIALYRLSK